MHDRYAAGYAEFWKNDHLVALFSPQRGDRLKPCVTEERSDEGTWGKGVNPGKPRQWCEDMIKKKPVQQETPLTWLVIFYYRYPRSFVALLLSEAINGRHAVARTIGKYMQLSNIAWLLDWNESLKNFVSQRVKITSISNPGWCLEVVLDGTGLLAKPFESIKTDTSEHDWVHCYVKNEIFYGVGGPSNFPEILHIFCLWATNNKYLLETNQPVHKIEPDFLWMQNWYHSQCDGEWEYSCILRMQTLDFPGWSIDIDVDETSLAARKFPSISIHESSSQWIDCWKEDSPSKFKGRCSSNKVLEVLAIFHRWAKEFRMLRDISY